MKVLLVDVNCKNSSTGKIVYDLYTGLNKRGIEAAVCYGRGPLIKEKNIFKFGIDLETYFHALMTRITGLTGFFSFFSTYRLIKFMKKFDPDVVHLHELHAYFVNYGTVIKYLKKNNIKTVWTFHCEFMYTGKCGHAYECDKWKTECEKCPYLREYPSSITFDFTKKMFNDKKELFEDFNSLTIVTPSKWLANRVKQSFLIDKKLEIVHNGIDTDNIFYPRKFDHIKKRHNIINEKIVLAVATDIMSENKGGRYILEIAQKMKDENLKFILIGVTDLDKNYDNNVIALRIIENQTELAEYYSMADVFVICSKRETFPTTCIEAISCGTPIYGFDVGGTNETAPNKLGEFVQYGDVDKLKNVLKKVSNNIKHSELKKECAKYGQLNYSREVMYNNYLKLYLKK